MKRANKGRFQPGVSGNPAGRRPRTDAAPRGDGWFNSITQMGQITRDKTASTSFEVDVVDAETAMIIWRGDDLAARIVEAIPGDALREGFEIVLADDKHAAAEVHGEVAQGYAAASIARLAAGMAQAAATRQDGTGAGADTDLESAAEQRMRDLNVEERIREALCYERALGGAAILLGVTDYCADLKEPLDIGAVKGLEWISVLEPRELQPVHWYQDPFSPDFGKPDVWRLVPISSGGGVTSTMIEVHESRLILFPGTRVTKRPLLGASSGWGDSIFTRVARALRDFNSSHHSAAVLMADFAQAVYKIKDLAATVATDGTGGLATRMTAIDLGRSVARAILVDTEEDFERKATPMSGLPETLDRLAARLAAAADMPLTLLMGQSPGGLNATGASDVRFYYDRVAQLQKRKVTPAVRKLVDIIFASLGKPPGSVEYDVKYNPLWQETDKERSDARKVQADIDAAYCGLGVYTPDEVALSRFGGDTFSYETKIDFAARAAQAAIAPPAPAAPPEGQPPGGDGGVGPPRFDAYNPDQPRAEDGRFGEVAGERGKGDKYAQAGAKAAENRKALEKVAKDAKAMAKQGAQLARSGTSSPDDRREAAALRAQSLKLAKEAGASAKRNAAVEKSAARVKAAQERVAKAEARLKAVRAKNAATAEGKPYAPVPNKDGRGFADPAKDYVRLYRGGGAGEFADVRDGTHGRWFTTSYDTASSYAGTDDSGMLKPGAAIIAVDVHRDKLPEFAEESTSAASRTFDYDGGLDDLIENGGNLPSGEGLEFYVDEESALAASHHDGDESSADRVKATPGKTVASAREANEARNWGGRTPPPQEGSLRSLLRGEIGDDDTADDAARIMAYMSKQPPTETGFTFSVLDHEFRTKGYSVAKYPEREKVFKGMVNGNDVRRYIEDNDDVFAKDPAAHAGGWFDPESGNFTLDISAALDSKEEALDLADRGGQAAIWDLVNKVPIEVNRAAAEARWKATQTAAQADPVRLRAGDDARADGRSDREDAARAWSRDRARARPVGRVDFDPDQARDESGKWTSGGGGATPPPKSAAGSAGASSSRPASSKPSTWPKRKEELRRAGDEVLVKMTASRDAREILLEERDKPGTSDERKVEIEREAARLEAESDALWKSYDTVSRLAAGPDTFNVGGKPGSTDRYEQGKNYPREGLPGGMTKHEAAGAYDPPEGIDDDARLKYGSDHRAREKAWEAAALKAVSLGELDVEVADAAGVYFDGHSDGGKGVIDLPPALYHVATAADLIRATGIKSRDELSQDRGLGLGGGASNTISFAATPEVAAQIQRGMLEFHDILNGRASIDDLIDAAARGDGAKHPYIESAISGTVGAGRGSASSVKEWITGVTRETTLGDNPPNTTAYTSTGSRQVAPEEWTREPDLDRYSSGAKKPYATAWRRVGDEAERLDRIATVYKSIVASREWAGGPMDPLFFSSNIGGFKSVPRDQIQILKFKPREGAKGYNMGGLLSEWRTWSGDAVELVDDAE